MNKPNTYTTTIKDEVLSLRQRVATLERQVSELTASQSKPAEPNNGMLSPDGYHRINAPVPKYTNGGTVDIAQILSNNRF